MALKFYIETLDSDGSMYRSEDGYDTLAEALDHLNADVLLHRLTGYTVESCSCGYGRWFTKGDLRRGIHVMPGEDEAELERVALAVGVLFPASTDGLRSLSDDLLERVREEVVI